MRAHSGDWMFDVGRRLLDVFFTFSNATAIILKLSAGANRTPSRTLREFWGGCDWKCESAIAVSGTDAPQKPPQLRPVLAKVANSPGNNSQQKCCTYLYFFVLFHYSHSAPPPSRSEFRPARRGSPGTYFATVRVNSELQTSSPQHFGAESRCPPAALPPNGLKWVRLGSFWVRFFHNSREINEKMGSFGKKAIWVFPVAAGILPAVEPGFQPGGTAPPLQPAESYIPPRLALAT